METKFKVYFEEQVYKPKDQVPMFVNAFSSDSEALNFALALHQAVECPHRIIIESPSGEIVCKLHK